MQRWRCGGGGVVRGDFVNVCIDDIWSGGDGVYCGEMMDSQYSIFTRPHMNIRRIRNFFFLAWIF